MKKNPVYDFIMNLSDKEMEAIADNMHPYLAEEYMDALYNAMKKNDKLKELMEKSGD